MTANKLESGEELRIGQIMIKVRDRVEIVGKPGGVDRSTLPPDHVVLHDIDGWGGYVCQLFYDPSDG